MIKPLISNRRFGLVMGILLSVFSILPLVRGAQANFYLLSLAGALLLFAFVQPRWLTPLNTAWAYFAHFNAVLIREIAVFIVFFLVIAPIGFIMRLTGHDPMQRRMSSDPEETYWIKRHEQLGSMKNQF